MKYLRYLLLVVAAFAAWNVIGLICSPLGAFQPTAPAFQSGADREAAYAEALRLTHGQCARDLDVKERELQTLGYTSNYCTAEGDVWYIWYEDWGPVAYPRYQFVTVRLQGDVVSAAEGHRIFWIVV